MLISFIIPTKDRAYVVENAINSILNQPYQNTEIIIINDASKDNLVNLINDKYKSQNRVKLINFESHVGQNIARNTGIKNASGEIVTIIDSDDEDYGTNLESIVNTFKDNPEITGIFTPVVSKSTGKLKASNKHCDIIFGFDGFIDGTYDGEYQPFLLKSKLPEKTFEEGLPVRRSCTMLSWLKLGKTQKFLIKNYKTRLYNDTGDDRLGGANTLINDANELVFYYNLMQKTYGDQIKQISSKEYAKIIASKTFYTLISKGRKAAINELFSFNLLGNSLYNFIVLSSLIILGPNISKHLKLSLSK